MDDDDARLVVKRRRQARRNQEQEHHQAYNKDLPIICAVVGVIGWRLFVRLKRRESVLMSACLKSRHGSA